MAERKIVKLDFFANFFWFIVLNFFPIFFQLISFSELFVLLFLEILTFILGFIFMAHFSSLDIQNRIIRSGMAFFLGSLLCGVSFVVLGQFCFLIIFLLLYFYRLQLTFHKYLDLINELIPFLLIFTLLFHGADFWWSTGVRLSANTGDYYYYNAIVDSISRFGTISDATYHVGVPISYPCLPFVFPALLVKLSGLNASIALWSVYMKFLTVFSCGLILHIVKYLYSIITKSDILDNYKMDIILVFFICYLNPLNYANIAKLDFNNLTFLGIGSCLPIGSPGFAMGLVWVCLIFYYYFKDVPLLKLTYRLILYFLFLCLGVSKIALFVPVAFFCCLLQLFLITRKRVRISFELFVSLGLLFIFISKFNSAESIVSYFVSTDNYFVNLFRETACKYSLQSRGLGMPILFFGVWIFYIFGLFLVFFIKFRKIIINYRLLFLVVNSLLISLLLFSGILLLVNVKFIGFDFRVSADMTHDLAQFMVAIFILVKIFFLILIVFNYESNRKITYSILLLSILSLGGYFSFVSNSFIRNDSKCTLWYKTVLTECNELENNGLFAMKGNSLYSGQVISGQGIGNWYCTGHRSDGGSYGSSLEVDRRNLLIDSFLNRFGTVNENNYLIYKLSKENVKYLIKRPDQEQIFEDLVESGCLSIVQGCRYVYKLQSRLN